MAMAAVLLAAPHAPAASAGVTLSERPARTPMFNGTVWATGQVGNTIFVGGDFTAAIVNGKAVPRGRLAAINAVTGALVDWAPTANAQVRSLVVSNGWVYVAGQFSTINGAKRDSLARIDAVSGRLSDSFQHAVVGNPYALAAGSGRLYVGGAITAVDGQRRLRLAAFRLDSGALDPSWRPTADDQVESLFVSSGRVYVGGKFQSISGASGTRRLAAVHPSTGAVISGFKAGATFITYGIVASGSRLYAVHGGAGGRLTAYDRTGRKRWTITMDGDPRAVVVLNGTIYVGGHFDRICRSASTSSQGRCAGGTISRVKMAAVSDSGRVQSWRADGNGSIGVLTMTADARLRKLAVGGAFTAVDGAPQRRFALFG